MPLLNPMPSVVLFDHRVQADLLVSCVVVLGHLHYFRRGGPDDGKGGRSVPNRNLNLNLNLTRAAGVGCEVTLP